MPRIASAKQPSVRRTFRIEQVPIRRPCADINRSSRSNRATPTLRHNLYLPTAWRQRPRRKSDGSILHRSAHDLAPTVHEREFRTRRKSRRTVNRSLTVSPDLSWDAWPGQDRRYERRHDEAWAMSPSWRRSDLSAAFEHIVARSYLKHETVAKIRQVHRQLHLPIKRCDLDARRTCERIGHAKDVRI